MIIIKKQGSKSRLSEVQAFIKLRFFIEWCENWDRRNGDLVVYIKSGSGGLIIIIWATCGSLSGIIM